MAKDVHITKSPAETRRLAIAVAETLGPGSVVALVGELGAGKTCFVQGIAKAFSVGKNFYVNSPTFTILNIYQGRMPLYHFDFYRLDKKTDVLELGVEEYFSGNGISVIEWAEKFPEVLPEKTIKVSFRFVDDTTREIMIER